MLMCRWAGKVRLILSWGESCRVLLVLGCNVNLNIINTGNYHLFIPLFHKTERVDGIECSINYVTL